MWLGCSETHQPREGGETPVEGTAKGGEEGGLMCDLEAGLIEMDGSLSSNTTTRETTIYHLASIDVEQPVQITTGTCRDRRTQI